MLPSRSALRLMVIALVCWLVGACTASNWSATPFGWFDPGFGRIVVALDAAEPASRGLQALPSGISKIEVHLNPVEGSPQFEPQVRQLEAATDLGTLIFDRVPAGKVRVTAKVFGPDGTQTGYNGREVEVLKDADTPVSIDVLYLAPPPPAKDIRLVRVSNDSIVLNIMPATGSPESDLIASASVTATVVDQNGDNAALRVIWSTTDPDRVTVVDGVIRTRRGGTLAGTASVIATAADDPTKTATISVVVTRLGGMNLEVR